MRIFIHGNRGYAKRGFRLEESYMYCSKCGKQLEEGIRFCKYCGAAVSQAEVSSSERADDSGIKQAEETGQKESVSDAATPKQKRNKNVILALALIAITVIAVMVVWSLQGESDSRVAVNSYALPELPDALIEYPQRLVDGQSLITVPDNRKAVQMAEDGTIAIMIDHKVVIYNNGTQIGEIPTPANYFYLCGSGEKIVYGTTNTNSYLWDIADSKSTLVSDTHMSYGISYDGNMLDMHDHYSRNGEEPQGMVFSYIRDMSPDGKYVYYGKAYRNTSSDGMEQHYSIFGVMINGKSYDLLSYSDPDYVPWIIACSQDYREVLFTFKDDIYYFSVDNTMATGFKAQHVGNVNGGILLTLNMATTANSITYLGHDVIRKWREYGDIGIYYNAYQYRTQKSVQNNVFCLLKEQSGMKTASIVRLVDNQLVELIPNITGNLCLSADETKLWCVADGRLTFCDLAVESPHAVYCDTAYVCAYVNEYGSLRADISGALDSWTVPIAATSDGGTACFISTDGSLWICTPDMIRNPRFITDNAFWVQCSADNEFYLMKGNCTEYLEGRFCELYLIGTDGGMTYQYRDVLDMYMTKSDVYIAVGRKSDSTYIGDTLCALYCKNDGGYKLIYDDHNVENIDFLWWGNY